MERFMMSVSDRMKERLMEESDARGLDNIQVTVRQIISEYFKNSEQGGFAFKGEVHKVGGPDDYYLAIGEPETNEREGIHYPLSDLFEPLLGKRITLIIKEMKKN